jgi:hypothetical protein
VDRALRSAVAALLCVAAFGCAPARLPADAPPLRAFRFATDTFAWANDSHWVLVPDPASGTLVWTPQDVRFALHCAGVVRAARQFLVHARFDPTAARVEPEGYLALARSVLARDPRATRATEPPIVIPGYRDLRTFSADFEPMLKEELLADWRSVVPRGDWRIVVPFTPGMQASIARTMFGEVRAGTLVIARVFRFPVMTINHAVLLFGATEDAGDLVFEAYDPNDASGPITIRFDTAAETFLFPARNYFTGGPVQVYEVYRGLLS